MSQEETIELFTNVNKNGFYPTDLWFRNGKIIVRWTSEDKEMTSDLLEEDTSIIWEVLKGIR